MRTTPPLSSSSPSGTAPSPEERWSTQVGPALRLTALTLLLTGLAYPLLVTGLAQLLFHRQAQGSFVADEAGREVGSELLAQGFSSPAYFQPRPSAAGDRGYDAAASSGSNLGPTSKKLRDGAAAILTRLQAENPDAPGPAPVELATSSGSGLDPHLSPAAARWQIPRIARARGVAPERVLNLIAEHTLAPQLGVLGEPRVNVLLLDLALDRWFGPPPPLRAPRRTGSDLR